MKRFSAVAVVLLFSCFFPFPVNADVKSQNFDEYRGRGLAAQQQGLFKEAMAYYTKALSTDPDRPEIYNDLGVVCEQLGNLYEAKNYYLEAVHLDTHYLPAYSNLAYLAKRQGDLPSAVEYFKKRIEYGGPADPWSREALEQLRAITAASPGLKEWIQNYEVLILDRRARVLAQQLDQEQEKAASDKFLAAEQYIQQAKAYEAEEMYAQALAEYDKALAKTPESPRVAEYRRLALVKLKESEIKALVDAGLEKLSAGDTKSAKEDFRQILTVIPDE